MHSSPAREYDEEVKRPDEPDYLESATANDDTQARGVEAQPARDSNERHTSASNVEENNELSITSIEGTRLNRVKRYICTQDLGTRCIFNAMMIASNGFIYGTQDLSCLVNTVPSSVITLVSAGHSGYKLYKANQELRERRSVLPPETEQSERDMQCQPEKLEEYMKFLLAAL